MILNFKCETEEFLKFKNGVTLTIMVILYVVKEK